ncbi:MAG: ribonuclease HII [Salaquimonas sp.]|nr:ribonuclease HII [Salaquimonas sp.]
MSPRLGTDSLSSPPKASSQKEGKPGFAEERRFYRRGATLVAGVDEAGRGPLAGPVVAAAVILDRKRIPDGIDDSKKLTRQRREEIFAEIVAKAQIAWAAQGAAAIDRVNIRQATLFAMTSAVRSLTQQADMVLIDGRDVPEGIGEQGRALIGGDGISLSIAAASIIAKVVRDRLMARACASFPGYGFSSHAGYGTAEHLDALKRLGPCPLHRRSFGPVRELLAAN